MSSRVVPSQQIWISSKIVVGADGHIKEDALPKLGRSVIRATLPVNQGKCRHFIDVEEDLPRATGTLEDVFAQSRTIVAGRIASSQSGFYGGMPGTLFEVAVDRRIRSVGHDSAAPSLFLFRPGATIETADGFICARGWAAETAIAVGDYVVVFSTVEASDEGRRVLRPQPDHVIVERDRTVVIPRVLSGLRKPGGSAANIVENIEAEARRTPYGKQAR